MTQAERGSATAADRTCAASPGSAAHRGLARQAVRRSDTPRTSPINAMYPGMGDYDRFVRSGR
ncbi:hypothetical protein GCM10010399_54130 [Dactylosporangium fulvum]|uniref:Uncharacterized protein n=1 Tax=Dactylosporangium fulvum TaxID=53359 RepID=A0ABY5WCS3_9ACTN|nr:hypothetical protein [Dactylosporangium fulvum]UWP87225.1 hypothetical protein Dfulv_24470 [Dactylosporangium fulvum]